MADSDTQNGALPLLVEENQRLRRAVEELSVLNDLARAIGASLDPDEIMNIIIRRSLRAVNAEQGVITLVEEDGSDSMKTLIRANAGSSVHEQFHFNQTLLGWMHLNKKPLLMNDPRNDDRFRNMNWEEDIRSLVCVPLVLKSKLTGVLTVYNKKTESFSDEDQRILAIIAAQSAQVIENARLIERERQLVKMQEEVRLAARIQTDLLPKEAPNIQGYDIAGKSIPAQVVGGDYFDFVPADSERLAICLGDVTGKGLPASLLMANVQATLRGQILTNVSVSQCIDRSNTLLHNSTGAEKFVTLFCGILDYRNHTLSYSNAGQDHPFHFSRDCEPVRLKTGGIMLGMLDTFPFEEETIEFEQGGILVIYSDGISEAMNMLHEQFGEERLADTIRANRKLTAAGLIDAIVNAARTHAGAAPQSDDMTVVVVKRLP